jgi:hypothetical protein
MVRRVFAFLFGLLITVLATSPLLAMQPAPQEEFKPFTGVPPGQQVPAAPLVIGVYAFFLLLMMFYLWTIWRRIGKVETDMRALERRQGTGPGSQIR